MLSTAWTLLVALTALCAAGFWILYMTVACARSSSAGIFLVTCVYAVDATFVDQLSFRFGVDLFPGDLLLIVLGLAASYRVLDAAVRKRLHWSWLLLGSALLFDLVRGFSLHGTVAGLESRDALCFWGVTAYIATFEYDEALGRRIITAYLWIAAVVGTVAIGRWILVSVDPAFHQKIATIDPTSVALLRVVQAGPAMALALGAVALAAVTLEEGTTRRTYWALIGLLALALLMQHRSVWVATAAGLASAVLMTWHRRRRPIMPLVLRFGAGALVAAALLLRFGGSMVSDSIETQAVAALDTEDGTFVGRIFGWYQLFEDYRAAPMLDQAVGFPFGHGYERYENETFSDVIDQSPHNQYLALLLRGGVIGLVAFLWAMCAGVRAAFRHAKSEPATSAMAAVGVALLVYYVPYQVHYSHSLVVGALLALIMRRSSDGKAPTA